jgi:hypothetical protein
MNHLTTLLVDTTLERDDAAAAATSLYLKLIGDGTISPVVDPGMDTPFKVVDHQLMADTGVFAIGLHASGHHWIDDGQRALMVDGGPENGIFCRYDGSFTIRCPHCRELLSPGGEGSEALEEALAVWCDSPDSAFVACPACSTWTPLTHWTSPTHDFAVGHFAISLHGVHMRSLTGGGNHAAMALRLRLGDLASDYTVVYSAT